MATLSFSRFCILALPLAAAVLLVTPADAKHRHGYSQPQSPRMAQPLTQHLDQPLRPKGKQRVRSRGKQPQKTQQETPDERTSPADVPVPEPRPADAQKTGAATGEEQKTESPKALDASSQLNEEKSRQAREARREPSVPEPSAREPSAETESEPEPPPEVPIPTQRPDTAEPQAEPPDVAPQPPEKPADAGDRKMLPDPRSADRPGEKMPAEEVACRERLKALGVEFEEHKAESDPEIGCSIPYPIVIKTLGKSIAVGPGTSIGIAPGTELNCKMAEAAARFAADVIQPAAKAELGADLKSIGQASAFVCRPRHGTRKLSEHAFGNALDIASFNLSDGRKIEISPTPPEKDAKFLNTVRKAACGPFKTVLGPGADADHAFHFHLDLEPRKHGGTFCQ